MLQKNPDHAGFFSLKFIDFGIAVFMGNNDPVFGPLPYMPPELLITRGFSPNAFRWIFGEPLSSLPGFPLTNYTQDSYALALLLPAILFGSQGVMFTSNYCFPNLLSPSQLFLRWRDWEESRLLSIAQGNNPGNQQIAQCAQFSNFLVSHRFDPQVQAQVQNCDQYLSGVSRANMGRHRLWGVILGHNSIQNRIDAKNYARQQAFQFILSHFSSLNQRMYVQTGRFYPNALVEGFAELFVAGISPHQEDRPTAQFMAQSAAQWCIGASRLNII
jgi:serine/threonine protein kinase